MSKSFFRKVGFGLSDLDKYPSNPLDWAIDQVRNPESYSWAGDIPTGDFMLERYARWVYQDRKILREKFKENRHAYNREKNQLRVETGEQYYENLELCIRHHAAIKGGSPVFERFLHFWGNHFAISKKDFLAEFSVGPYQREIIRPALLGTFENLVTSVTTSWPMIHHLDNSESIGPSSKSAEWREKKGKISTINENHARELFELHTVSPKAGYTQADVIQLSYIMTGWEHEHSETRLECNPVRFNWKKHQRGDHSILGHLIKYRGNSSKNKLHDAIKFLTNHDSSRNFICQKLCQHFISDDPTNQMIEPVVKAWKRSGGNLPDIHEAVLRQAYNFSSNHKKFIMPETWFLQMVRMGELSWPPSSQDMEYTFKFRPSALQRKPEKLLRELGHNPFRPIQPNGFPDTLREWVSPELLIRRLVVTRKIATQLKGLLLEERKLNELILRNFDNKNEIFEYLSKTRSTRDKLILLLCGPWMLKA